MQNICKFVKEIESREEASPGNNFIARDTHVLSPPLPIRASGLGVIVEDTFRF
jgi:hypothetical protein